jgi:methylglyoxal synthase
VLEVFGEAMGNGLTLAEFTASCQVMADGGVLTLFDDKFDFVDVMRWLKIIQTTPEVRDVLKESGAAKALYKSAEVINERESARLQEAVRRLSPFKDLIKAKIPEALGSDLHVNETDNSEHDPEFTSAFSPLQMRCLALVSHNQMKGTMRKFVESNKNLLKKFRLTGTNSTMTMLKEVFGDDPLVIYGSPCKSGPLGGDAQLVAAMCNGELGGMIFFQDPMISHMHSVDIQCLNRQALIHNVMTAMNPTSALMATFTLRMALMEGKAEYIPSFMFTLECPTVEMYVEQQKAVIQANIEAQAVGK